MPEFNAMSQAEVDHHFMALALEQADLAQKEGEVPVGAILVKNNEIISMAYNKKEGHKCSIDHAEILAIQKGSKILDAWRLSDCTLYITLEPCVMCAGAIIASRINRIVYGTKDPKAGAVGSVFDLSKHNQLNHSFEVATGVMQPQCSDILKKFFASRRKGTSTDPR